tara:strand:+ start:217 stop:1185 length:969 start_codon:yes stop_codon:yes gene_type:complete
MTKDNDTSTLELEKKYMNILSEMTIESKEFIKLCKNAEITIKNNYHYYKKYLASKNKIAHGFENLISYTFQKYCNDNDIIFSPYFSAISSDLAFVMDDCIINIDAKTVDLDGNEGDADDISVLKNQITWKHEPLFCCNYVDDKQIIEFSGMRYDGNQKPFEKELPCLTFILKLIYKDDFDSFNLNNAVLTCVPSYAALKEENLIDENTGLTTLRLIQGFKTYDHIISTDTQYGNKYKPIEEIENNWVGPFKLKGSGLRKLFYIMKDLKDPSNNSKMATRSKMAQGWCVNLGGDAARLLKNPIENRKDSKNDSWIGFRKIKIN